MYIGVVVLLVIAMGVAFGAWTLFVKPLSASEYEIAVEDGLMQLSEGTDLMGEAVRGLVGDAQAGLSAQDISRYQSDFAAGEKRAREACANLDSLRTPDEYTRVQRDLERYTSFMVGDVLDPYASFMREAGSVTDTEELSRRLVRASERSSQRGESARGYLDSVLGELYLTSLDDPMSGLALLPVSVTVSWQQPVDVDLIVKDAVGGQSYGHLKDRDATGGAGQQSETIVFRDHDGEDLSRGTYQVIAFYAGRAGTDSDEVQVTVTMTLPTGAVIERQRLVDFDTGSDEWYVFEVDSLTGQYGDLDWLE